MTLQEAQRKFSKIISSMKVGDDALTTMEKLDSLQASLPLEGEFKVLNDAITEAQGKLHGAVTAKTLKELKQTEAGVVEAAVLLSQVATKADKDARVLTFAKPTLIAAALSESVSQLQEIKTAANTKDFEQVAAKALALTALLQQIQESIKEV